MSNFSHRFFTRVLGLVVILASSVGTALGLPEGITVTEGDVSLSQPEDVVLNIHQHSDTASINFTDFSIGVDETVNVIQPSADAIALGHVLGVNPSEIFGHLHANGQFFLINPNGIVFGESASVNVNGLIASTLSLTDEDISSGQWVFQQDGSSPSGLGVINEGSITAGVGGYVALLSDTVINHGRITADDGTIAMVSADAVTVSFSDGLTPTIALDSATYQGLVSNSGVVQADNGWVVMSAAVNNALMETVVNNSGVIEAQGVAREGGRVFLTSHGAGDVVNTGHIQASGDQGGQIRLAGDRVAQLGQLQANGDRRGGHIAILSDHVAALGENSEITVDGGNTGGTVLAISQQQMIFRGGANISATGQQQGGFVEVSGYDTVEIQGTVDTSSSQGNSGTFLIDPFDVTITGVTNNNGEVGGVFTPSGATSTIDVATLEANLALGDVRVETTNVAGSEAGDLTVASAINLDNTDGNTLTLQADGSLFINNAIRDQNTGTADATGLQFISGGNIVIADGVEVNAGAGVVSLTAGGNVTATGLVTTSTANNALTIIGATIADGGDTLTDIDANNGGVSISIAAGNVSGLETAVDTLSVSISGGGQLAITEQDDMTVQTLSGVNDLQLVTPGTVTLQDAGLNISNSINIQAADLVDADRIVNISASDLLLQLSATAGDVTLQTSVDRADVSVTGVGGATAHVTLTESNGIQIEDLNGDNNALVVSNGNLQVLASAGDLAINDTVSATDGIDDGVRAGLIDLQLDQGDILIGDQGSAIIESINTVDNTENGGLGSVPTNQVSIRVLHNDTSDQSHNVVLGNSTGNDVSIAAQGGDILIDSYNDASLTLGNTRTITVNSDVQIAAYDALVDLQDGAVDLGTVVNLGNVAAHTGRAVTLRENATLDVDSPDVVVDVSSDVTETIQEETDLVASGSVVPVGQVSDANRLFSSVFTRCTPSEEQEASEISNACALEQTMQRFLGTLLIGGDLPAEEDARE